MATYEVRSAGQHRPHLEGVFTDARNAQGYAAELRGSGAVGVVVVTIRTPTEELQLALTRYERLCSPPRWMTVPYCSDIASYERAQRRAIDTGNESRAAEIRGWLCEEYRRRFHLTRWTTGSVHGVLPVRNPHDRDHVLQLDHELHSEQWKGRTVYAWSELLSRMVQARQNAVGTGALDRASESYRAISDRIRDVEHRIAVAKRRETQGQPAVA